MGGGARPVIGAGLALKADGNAQASAKASVSVEAGGKLADKGLLDRDSAQASVGGAAAASASASADARGDAGLQFQYRTTTKEGRSSTAKVSRIVSEGGDVRRTAAGEIRDAGTVIDAAGDVSQRAGSINRAYSSLDGESLLRIGSEKSSTLFLRSSGGTSTL